MVFIPARVPPVLANGGPVTLSGTGDPPTSSTAADGTMYLRTDPASIYLRRNGAWRRISKAWDPTYVSGLITWLQSDSGVTTSSGAVTSVLDQTTNAHNYVQATTTSQPTLIDLAWNGEPAIRGNADRKRHIDAGAYGFVTGSGTIIYVFSHSSQASTYHTDDGVSHGIIEGFTTTKLEWFNGADRYDIAASVSAGTPHIATISQKDTTILDLYYDGVFLSTHVPAIALIPPRYLLSLSASVNGSNGDFLSMLLFNRNLNAAELVQIHRYLGDRYGIPVD